MFLEGISAVSLPRIKGSAGLGPLSYVHSSAAFPSSFCPNLSSLDCSSSFSGLVLGKKRGNYVAVSSSNDAVTMPLTEMVFQPFKEIKKDEFMIPVAPHASLARQRFSEACEAVINEQINVEYSVSYVYHALYAYFDRDNIALKGLAKFFKESSKEEREHAEKLMEYQNKRGGRVKLLCVEMPPTEFDHVDKGDALCAMELAFSLEKLTNEKLLKLHSIADENNDPQLADFIETGFLKEQVEAIKNISEYVAQLRRVGKGHGVWHFDQMLLHEGDRAV